MRSLFLFFLTASLLVSSLYAQESIYGLAVGFSYTSGTVSIERWQLHESSDLDISQSQIPIHLSGFFGSRESGGLTMGLDVVGLNTILEVKSDWGAVGVIYMVRKGTLGYQWCANYKTVLIRYGFDLSGYFNLGAYCDNLTNSSSSGSMHQELLALGVDAEFDWFPFDTGGWFLDGLHFLARPYVDHSITDLKNWNIGALFGIGIIL